MIAGYGAVPLLGYVIVTVNDTDLPPSPAVIVRVLPLKEAVSEDGFGGLVPSS